MPRLPAPIKSPFLSENSNIEDLSGSLAFSVNGRGEVSLFSEDSSEFPNCQNLALSTLVSANSTSEPKVLSIHVNVKKDPANPGSSGFVLIQPRSWYPSCDFTKTYWMGDAVAPFAKRIYDVYGPLNLPHVQDEDSLADDSGIDPTDLHLKISADGSLRIATRDYTSEFIQRLGVPNPKTGNPDKYTIIFGIFGYTEMTVTFTGSAILPGLMSNSITVKHRPSKRLQKDSAAAAQKNP